MNKKIINNAISAYLWLWALLLLPSKKENINNPFVKKHAKTAVFIHILMLINYIIFISFSFLWNFWFYWFYLNHVLASIIFIWLFGWILFWVKKAYSWDEFNISDMSNMTKTDKIVEIKNSNLNEEWILTIILSLIPFIWFIIKWKFNNYKSQIIENNIKLNLIITFLISLLYTTWYENLGLLFWLFYLIFIWFYSILIISKQNIISINLLKFPTFEEIYIYFLSIFEYLKNYFSAKKFVPLNELIKNKKLYIQETEKLEKELLNNLKEEKLPSVLAYIPYLNIIKLIDIKSKNKNHIINWLLITILSIILILLKLNNYQIFIVFLVFFGIWYLKNPNYKIHLLFDIYQVFANIFNKFFSSSKKAIDMQKEIKEVSFKIEQ